MIQPVSTFSPKVTNKGCNFEGGKPVNLALEKKLAVVNAGGISAVAGAFTTAVARSYTASWKHAGLFGGAAALVTMMFICPRLLYKSGFNLNSKNKNTSDVFTKEKSNV